MFDKDKYVLSTDSDSNQKFIANHHFLLSASFSGRVQARGMAISHQDPGTGDLQNVSEKMELAEHNNPHVQVRILNKILAIFR